MSPLIQAILDGRADDVRALAAAQPHLLNKPSSSGLVEVPVTLGQKPADAVWLARVDKPTDAQKAAYQAWLGAPWAEPR